MILFMGVAGAGKSVQGKLLAEKLGYQWISTGEILRAQITGQRRQEMLEGKLLADDEIIQIIKDFFKNKEGSNNCVLDGFPRTLNQAKWLIDFQKASGPKIDSVIHLKASKDVVKQRLLNRGRPDDNEAAIDKRFAEYESQTLPIVGWFKQIGLPVHEVDGEAEVEAVHKSIFEKVKIQINS